MPGLASHSLQQTLPSQIIVIEKKKKGYKTYLQPVSPGDKGLESPAIQEADVGGSQDLTRLRVN